MSSSVALSAQAYEIVRIQSDRWIGDVVRSDRSDVMHLLRSDHLASFETVLTEPFVSGHAELSGLLPLFGFVELPSKVFHK